MNYKVRRQGVDLGIFSLDELRRRRDADEFSGDEYVQREGMADWQPLDLVLQQGYRVMPPPLPSSVFGGEPNHAVISGIVVLGIILFGVVISLFVNNVRKGYLSVASRQQNLEPARSRAATVASRSVSWTTNTLTQVDASRREREFRIRQWLEGYETRGQRNSASDEEVEQFIRVWIARNYGGADATNELSLAAESDRLANNPECTDPLVLTVAAGESPNRSDSTIRFERALAAYPQSRHRAYPKFYAMVLRGDQTADRSTALDNSALQEFQKCFADGSFTPADQQEIGEIFVNGWGADFFHRHADSICAITRTSGPDYQWLALVLDGENHIQQAWLARGNGYANTVTEQGWQGFREHLKDARKSLEQAWKLQPDFPLAPCRMMTVALGDSEDIGEMRTWFDRAVAGQIDYPGAWSEMRWGLRPRWYGNEEAMLTLGKTAIATGRFDTDIPRKFIDCVYDVESEESVATGHHIFGRNDVWPHLQQMYEGYIAAPSQVQYRDGWRTAFAVVAYFAGKYDVSRTQLEALDWKLLPRNMAGWNVDRLLMPLEVAARTGSVGGKISDAESTFNNGDLSSALKQYTALDAVNTDARTREFIQIRVAALRFSQQLQNGEWVDFMPLQNDDPNWIFGRGKIQQLGDGTLEIESATNGHSLFCRTQLGANFEVKGAFEVVQPSDRSFFQAGLVLGVPDIDSYNWYSFRIRHSEQGDLASIGRGWTKTETFSRVALNRATNSFDFIFQNGKVTAAVNGIEVFHQAVPPVSISVPDNSFALGLGAYTTANTVIRYRDMQVRKLN